MKKRLDRSALGNLFPIVFIGTTVLAGLVSFWVWVDVKEDRFKDLKYTADIIDSYYELTFNQRELILYSVGQRLLAISGQSQNEERLNVALDYLEKYEEFLAFGLADTTGQLIVFTGSKSTEEKLPNLALSPQTKRSFYEAKKSNKLVIGEVYFFDEINDWILPIRVPIRDENGQLIAINTSAIDLKRLYKELETLSLNTDYKVHLVNNTFKSTQIYYPYVGTTFNESDNQLASVLRVDESEIYEEFDTITVDQNLIEFSAKNKIDNADIIGVKTQPNSYNHHLLITVDNSVLWNEFWVNFRVIILVYLILIVNLFFLLRFFKKKEKQFNSKIISERDYYTKIINSTHTIIVGVDTEFKCTFLNPAAEKISGYTQDEVIGKAYWEELYPGKQYKQVETAMEYMKSHKNLFNYEMELVAKNRDMRLISWNTINFNDDDGNLKEIICFGVDITEQRKAENVIRKSQANLKSLFESTNNIIGLFDTDFNLIEFNQAFIDATKQTDNVDLYKGIPILEVISRPQAELFRGFLTKAINGEKVKEVVDYPEEQGGFSFYLSYNPIEQGNEITGVAMYVQDVTELKSAQFELKRYSEKLESLVKDRTIELEDANHDLQNKNKELQMQREELKVTIENLKETQSQLILAEKMASLGILAAGVGHEINNPLNFIKGGANGIAVQLNNITNKEIAKKVKPFIKIIDEGVNRASTIVKSLRHFSRQGLNMNEECNIHDVLDNCLVILHNKTKHKVDIIKEYTTEDVCVVGNEGKLHQAFLNILANAEQAIPDTGEIKITTKSFERELVITISDNGTGIDKNIIDKISDPFFTTKSPGEGTGLGLSITYNIIEEHLGTVKVKSTLKKGTEFIITLPKKIKGDC